MVDAPIFKKVKGQPLNLRKYKSGAKYRCPFHGKNGMYCSKNGSTDPHSLESHFLDVHPETFGLPPIDHRWRICPFDELGCPRAAEKRPFTKTKYLKDHMKIFHKIEIPDWGPPERLMEVRNHFKTEVRISWRLPRRTVMLLTSPLQSYSRRALALVCIFTTKLVRFGLIICRRVPMSYSLICFSLDSEIGLSV